MHELKKQWPAAPLSQLKATRNRGSRMNSARAAGLFWTFTMSNSEALVSLASRGFTLRRCGKKVLALAWTLAL
jgi:hypothetical protein